MIHPNLEKVLRGIGWGDPDGGLWFAGLEGAGTWANQAELDDYDNRPEVTHEGAIAYECSEPPGNEAAEHKHDPRGQVWRWQSRIATSLSRTHHDVDDYARRCLWFRGYGVFQTNLYPLEKPRLNQWPSHYQELFGIGPADQDRYKLIVRNKRFPLIRQFHSTHRPQATICFGKTSWTDFEDLFDLRENPADPDSDGDIRLYPDRRTILTRFLGVGQMSHARAQRIITTLSSWKVSLP